MYSGWKLDYKKFRIYLTDKFKAKKVFLFIGFIPENQKLYDALRSYDYKLICKPTIKDHSGKPKGNVDAELVLHSAIIQYENYNQAVIVSGDGDFYCLHQYLKRERKLLKIIIPNRKSESSLLKRFQNEKVFLERERKKVELA
ncbi:MAG TPA: NYN domain-containing protein [Candidatus Dojkabacteria bacterium]|nr:NYN domain-containing protein [Candidatus Dojkabacteria bacterium]